VSYPLVCKRRGHTHKDWMRSFACDFDTLGERDEQGYLIRTEYEKDPEPPAPQPGAALDLFGGVE